VRPRLRPDLGSVRLTTRSSTKSRETEIKTSVVTPLLMLELEILVKTSKQSIQSSKQGIGASKQVQ